MSRTGIRERRIAAPHETTATLAAIAAKRAIAVAGLEPEDIDLILRRHADARLLDAGHGRARQGGHRQLQAVAFDVMAACSGFVYAYATADAFIRSGIYATRS